MNVISQVVSVLFGVGLLVWFVFEAEDHLPENVRPVVINSLFAAVIIGVFQFLYFRTQKHLFLSLRTVGIVPIVWGLVGARLKREYARKTGKSADPDAWVCRKCGEENHKVRKECVRYRSMRDSVAS